jgi:uncharacterized membrane protein
MTDQPANKTSTGMQQNVEALLCYVLGWITGIIFFIMEKENRLVRFHALQSIIVFGAISIVEILVIMLIHLNVGGIIVLIVSILSFILWIFLLYKASLGQMFKLPVIGEFAEQLSKPEVQK